MSEEQKEQDIKLTQAEEELLAEYTQSKTETKDGTEQAAQPSPQAEESQEDKSYKDDDADDEGVDILEDIPKGKEKEYGI